MDKKPEKPEEPEEPEKLTKQNLKSRLSHAGIDLPNNEQRKSFYLDLYNKNKELILKSLSPPVSPITKKTSSPETSKEQSSSSKQANKSEMSNQMETNTQDIGQKRKRNTKNSTPEEDDSTIQNEDVMSDNEDEQPQKIETQSEKLHDIEKSGETKGGPINSTKRRKTTHDKSITFKSDEKNMIMRRQTIAGSNSVVKNFNYSSRKSAAPSSKNMTTSTHQNLVSSLETNVNPQENAFNELKKRRISSNYVSPSILRPNVFKPDFAQPKSDLNEKLQQNGIGQVSEIVKVKKLNGEHEYDDSQLKNNETRPPANDQANHLINILLTITRLLIWVVIFIVIYFFAKKYLLADPTKPLGLPYCDSQRQMRSIDTTECQKCPDHGYCIGGKLAACEPTYVIKNAMCVQDEFLTNTVLKFIEGLQYELSLLEGQRICSNQKEVAGIEEEKIKNRLMLLCNNDSNYWKRFKDLSSIDTMGLKIKTTDGKQLWYATNPRLPLICSTKKTIIENSKWVITCTLLLSCFIILKYLKWRDEQRKRDIDNMVRLVLKKLRETGQPCIASYIRDSIKEENSDQIYSDINKIWPAVCEEINSDSRVKERQQTDGITWEIIETSLANSS